MSVVRGLEENYSEMELLRCLLLSLVLVLFSFGSATKGGEILEVVENVKRGPGQNWWVPAMFVFGDSVLDAGTNSYIPSLLQANFLPYGTHYFGQATGRFTNGRTYADFFANNYIGLGLPDPYLKRKGPWEIMQGVNYASAGSGLLRTTNAENGVIPFPDQILQFGETKDIIYETQWSEEAAKEHLWRSIFLINIGANDIFAYISNQSDPQRLFIDGLLVILKASIKVLYEAGARKVMILGVGPLGCVPGAVAAAGVTNGQCVESWNDIGQEYNAALEKMVFGLKETFPEIKAIIGKPYDKLNDMVHNGSKYGFTAGFTACCGSGIYNAEVQCGRPADVITNVPSNLCDEVDKHLFWDNYHPSEKAYGLVAEEFWSGNSSYVAPINLKTLVEIEPEWNA